MPKSVRYLGWFVAALALMGFQLGHLPRGMEWIDVLAEAAVLWLVVFAVLRIADWRRARQPKDDGKGST